jgi:hypothetical protein
MVNAATVAEPEDMDVDSADASGSQTNSAPGTTAASSGGTFTFELKSPALQSAPLADKKLAPRQGDHSYLDGISYELRREGLEYLHDKVEMTHCRLSPYQGMLLDQDGLYELTHNVDARILRDIHSEAQSLPTSPSAAWLEQKYKKSLRTAHTALGDRSKFLTKVKEILHTRDVEMAGTSAKGSGTDAPLTQKEFDALKPLSAPPSLQGFPINRRKHVLCRMLRKAKHMNNRASSAFKEHLQPAEMLDMVHQEELTVLQRISNKMQNSPSTPTDAEIEQEYDSQSESELKDCSKLDSFVGKFKTFHRRIKGFFSSTKDKISDVFCLGGTSGASQVTQNASSPPVQDTKSAFISALSEAINKMNDSVSHTHNGGQIILQPAQVTDLALKLEARMSNDLGEKYIGTPLTAQQQETLYIQAGNEFLQRIGDVGCFLETVKAYFGMAS